MSEQVRQIAARIKELREISGISLETLAREFNVPLETYQDYESGNTDIPIGFLYEVANRFHVDLAAILTGGNAKLHSYSIVKKGKGVIVERKKQYRYEHLAYNFMNKNAEPFLVTVNPEPESVSVSCSSHPGQEFNYVIEGTLKIIVNGHDIILNEGDSLYFDSSLNHGMKAMGDKPAKFLAIIF